MMNMSSDRYAVFAYGVEWIEETFDFVADQITWEELRVFAETNYAGGFAQLKSDALAVTYVTR